MPSRLAAVMILVCSVASTLSAQRPMTDSAAVSAVVREIIAADNARSIERVMRAYSDSAWLLPPGEAAVTTRGEIRARYEALFRDYQPKIESRIDEIRVAGALAWVVGQNSGTLTPIGALPARALNDSFLMVVAKDRSGAWRIHRLMWAHRLSG
jgi:uncharacterized protein (TIGR02246 family)